MSDFLRYRFIYFIIIFLIFSLHVFSQTVNYDSVVSTGVEEIYDIKFSDAEKTFKSLIAGYPDHPAGKFFLAMIDWWKIMLNPDNESYDDIFYQKLEDVISECDNILEKHPNNFNALFFKGGAIGFRGRLRAYRDSWLKAANDGHEAMPLVEKAAKINPNNNDVQLGFGIYDYYASVIPDEYPFLKPLMIFFPKGDKKRGLEELNKTAKYGKFAKYEARYFLMTLYYNFENNPYKADEYADLLVKDFPDNPVFERWKGRIEAKKGNFTGSANIFKDVLSKAKKKMPGYDNLNLKREASYYVGLQYRNINQLDSSEYYFNMCKDISKQIDKDEESGFLINSYLYLGMINDLKGKRNIAVDYYNKLLKMKEFGQSHELAEQYLKTPYGVHTIQKRN
jgi:tetratricopeptide (TPR) repeat protein